MFGAYLEELILYQVLYTLKVTGPRRRQTGGRTTACGEARFSDSVLKSAEKPGLRDIIPHRAAPDQMINKWYLISAWKHARWRSADEACATIGAALGM